MKQGGSDMQQPPLMDLLCLYHCKRHISVKLLIQFLDYVIIFLMLARE